MLFERPVKAGSIRKTNFQRNIFHRSGSGLEHAGRFFHAQVRLQLREALPGAVLNDADDLSAAVAEFRSQFFQRDICETRFQLREQSGIFRLPAKNAVSGDPGGVIVLLQKHEKETAHEGIEQRRAVFPAFFQVQSKQNQKWGRCL